MITGIAMLLLGTVTGFELMLRGVPEVPQAVEQQTSGPSLSASATPAPAEATQPAATAVATEPTDEAEPVTPTASG